MIYKANPYFSELRLYPVQATWYSRLLDGLTATKTSTVDQMATAGSEALGFSRHYVDALVGALDATGSPDVLDQIWRYAELLRLRHPYPPMSGKDAAFLVSFEALLAYVFQSNRDLGTKYAEAAEYWKTHCESMLTVTNGVRTLPTENLTHSFTVSFEAGVHLAAATGNQSYYDQARQRALTLMRELRYHGEDPYLDHRMPINYSGALVPLEIHRTYYLRYTLVAVVNMWRLSFPTIPKTDLVQMVRRNARPRGAMPLYMAVHDELDDVDRQGTSCLGAVIPFDPTGEIAATQAAYWNNTPAARSQPYIAAFMLHPSVKVI